MGAQLAGAASFPYLFRGSRDALPSLLALRVAEEGRDGQGRYRARGIEEDAKEKGVPC